MRMKHVLFVCCRRTCLDCQVRKEIEKRKGPELVVTSQGGAVALTDGHHTSIVFRVVEMEYDIEPMRNLTWNELKTCGSIKSSLVAEMRRSIRIVPL